VKRIIRSESRAGAYGKIKTILRDDFGVEVAAGENADRIKLLMVIEHYGKG